MLNLSGFCQIYSFAKAASYKLQLYSLAVADFLHSGTRNFHSISGNLPIPISRSQTLYRIHLRFRKWNHHCFKIFNFFSDFRRHYPSIAERLVFKKMMLIIAFILVLNGYFMIGLTAMHSVANLVVGLFLIFLSMMSIITWYVLSRNKSPYVLDVCFAPMRE